MDKYEFIRHAVGLPWVDRACSWQAMDCYGVVVMYFRYVYGEELPCAEGYQTHEKSLIEGFADQAASGKWLRVEQPDGDGIAFMHFKDGLAAHTGVIVDGAYVLHAAGNAADGGQVRCDKIDVFRRFHGGEMQFYKYEGWTCL